MNFELISIFSGFVIWWINILFTWYVWRRVFYSSANEKPNKTNNIITIIFPLIKQIILFGFIIVSLEYFYTSRLNFLLGLVLGLIFSPLLYKLLEARSKN